MGNFKRVLVSLLAITATLFSFAAAAYIWLRYELERTPNDPAEIAAFFAQAATRPDFVPGACG